MKIIITESQLKKLNEDITASRMIVYHRTGKKTGFNPSKNIADIGYNIGKGDYYGYGVYTTYDLESQLNNNMRNTYGNIIIESKILDISKFLIFNYDIAKKIYKSRYQFRDQLEQILGKKEWLNYKNNDDIKDIHYTLDEGNVEYTSKLARDFSKLFRDSILRKLNGMIFTGENDGNVLVVYNRRNIEPLRYSEDDGQTWTNVRNVKTYQRIKDSDEYKNNTEIQHILNKIENEGLAIGFVKMIPEKYHDILLNNLSKKGDKLNRNEIDFINNLKFFKKFGDFDIFNILKNSKDKEQTALEIIEIKGDRLSSIDIHNILLYFRIPDNKDLIDIDILVRKIIEVKGEKLEYELVENLLEYSNDKDLIVSKIIETKGEKLSNEIRFILQYSTDKDLIAKKIIDIKGKELMEHEISYLLQYSTDKDLIVKKIIDIKGKELNTQNIHYLLDYSTDKDLIAKKIIDVKGDKLNYDDIHYLHDYSKDKDIILTKIIDVKGDKLDANDINYLLHYSKNKDFKDFIVTKIIEKKGDKLDVVDIHYLLDYSKNNVINTKKIISFGHMISEERYRQLVPLLQKYYKRIRGLSTYGYYIWEFKYLTDGERIKYIETKGERLTDDDVRLLVTYSDNKDDIITKIIKTKGEGLNVVDYARFLILHSVNKNDIGIKIIEAKGDKLTDDDINDLFVIALPKNLIHIPIKIIEMKGSELNKDNISLLLSLFKNDKELIKKTLLQNGVDYKLINDAITSYNIDTPLIPDNYQSMLQEIKRIKEIMI